MDGDKILSRHVSKSSQFIHPGFKTFSPDQRLAPDQSLWSRNALLFSGFPTARPNKSNQNPYA
jgi:hypothetical protein